MLLLTSYIILTIVLSSVPVENRLRSFTGLGDTVQVPARLDSTRLEKDSDIHLLLVDSVFSMVAEIMSGTPARKQFETLFGQQKKLGKVGN